MPIIRLVEISCPRATFKVVWLPSLVTYGVKYSITAVREVVTSADSFLLETTPFKIIGVKLSPAQVIDLTSSGYAFAIATW